MDQNKPDAELIKYRLRSEANLSLKQLSKLLNRDPSTISMVIHGRRKSAPIMRAIFAILDANQCDEAISSAKSRSPSEEDAA